MSKTKSPKEKSSARTKKSTPEKSSTLKVKAEICPISIAYSSLDDAIETLVKLKKDHEQEFEGLYIDERMKDYTDDYGLYLYGYRDEMPSEKRKREEQAYQQARYERETYERLKAKFENK